MEQQLFDAIAARDLQQVRELLSAGANPNAKQGEKTAYQLVPHGADEIKCELIEAGAEDPELLHALVWVILTGRTETVRVLLEKGADVNVSTYSGTPIQVAASRGYSEIAELLIAAGADLDAGSGLDTPLLAAIERGHFDVALQLVAAGADPNLAPQWKNVPPLATAAAQGATEVIQALLNAGAELEAEVANLTLNQLTLGQQAAAGLQSAFAAMEAVGKIWDKEETEVTVSELSEVEETLDRAQQSASQLKAVDPDNAIDTTPALLAARCGHSDALAVLLEAGADPYRRDGEGLSAVDWAIRNEDGQVRSVLRRFGAGEPRVSGEERLLNAAEAGDISIVRDCVAQGVDVNTRDRRRKTKNFPPLMLAVAGEHLPVVEILLNAGADPNLADGGKEQAGALDWMMEHTDLDSIASFTPNLGRTPLMLGAIAGNLPLVRMLLQGQADCNFKDNLGYTALFLACQKEHLEIARTLIEAGAEVTAKNNYNETVLMRPSERCNLPLLRLLLERGVDVNIVSKGGETALAAAAGATQWIEVQAEDEELGTREYTDDGIQEERPLPEAQVLEVVETLLQAGADPNLPNCSTTPLGAAASRGYLGVMERLLAAGAQIDLETEDGETALDFAHLYDQDEALTLLKQRSGNWEWKNRWDREEEESEEDEEELWGPELPIPDFSTAAQTPEFQQSVADLGELCGSKPTLLWGETPGVFQVHVNSKRRSQIDVEVIQQQFLERGCFVYQPNYDREGPKKLCIAPTTDKYDIIALHQTNGGNYGIGPGYVVQWLKELEGEQPFVLTCIAHDTLSGRFLTPIQNPEGLAQRMYEFCPDIVEQGCGSIARLAESLEFSSNLFFWWD